VACFQQSRFSFVVYVIWVEIFAAYRIHENQDYETTYNGKGYPQNIP